MISTSNFRPSVSFVSSPSSGTSSSAGSNSFWDLLPYVVLGGDGWAAVFNTLSVLLVGFYLVAGVVPLLFGGGGIQSRVQGERGCVRGGGKVPLQWMSER